MRNFKMFAIISSIFIISILLFAVIFATTNNRAISLEEQINGASSEIKVQEKRRVDLIYNLVDTVEAYSKYEGTTLATVTEARTDVDNGNIEEAQMAITAVAEAYPELKASENYNQLMTELALTENMIAQSRNNYNVQVKEYNKFVRSFPASMFLNIMSYEKVDFNYTDYNVSEDAPQNLFD